MIRIDLGKDEASANKKYSPKEILKKLNVPPHVVEKLMTAINDVTGVVMVVVALGLSALLPLFLNRYKESVRADNQAQIKEIKQKTENVGAEIVRFSPLKTELESYEQQKRVVNDRLAIVRTLLEQRATSISVLDAVGQSLPPRAWVNSIDFILQPEPSVALVGGSFSNEEVSDFVEKLTDSIYFQDVSLDDVSTGKADNLDIKAFSITAKPKIKLVGSLAAAGHTP